MLCTKNAGQGRGLEVVGALLSSNLISFQELQVVQYFSVAHCLDYISEKSANKAPSFFSNNSWGASRFILWSAQDLRFLSFS